MKCFVSTALLVGALLMPACSSRRSQPSSAQDASQNQLTIGGAPAVVLTRPRQKDTNKPQFLQVTVLPGRGMNLWQIRAFLPGKGNVDLLASPSLPDAKTLLDSNDDEFGNKSFSAGGAILLPWANRIRGKLSDDKKTIVANIAGKEMSLPANWHGKQPDAELNAMHGLILRSAFQNVEQNADSDSSRVSAVLHAGDFGGHWPSSTDVKVTTTLKDDAVELVVTATNVGQDNLPIGFGWHPYFALPSGKRGQARLLLPSSTRVLVNNYDDVFPTGRTEPVKETLYDFTIRGGRELGNLYLDDNFINVQHQADGSVASEIIDRAADYGLRITALTPEIKAIQIYAPPDKSFIVLEPQTNLADPYSKVWGKTDTGMVELQPGQSLTYRVRLEMFLPSSSSSAGAMLAMSGK